VCFSPQGDLIGGIVVGAIGIDVIRHVDWRREQLALAALPLLLAAHQLDETFVWWGLQGHVPAGVGRVAMWVYLLFAFVVLPVYVPIAVWRLEPPGRRRTAMVPFIAVGTVVSVVLLATMVKGPVTASLGNYHVSYGTGLHAGFGIVVAYVVATCGSLLFSSVRIVAVFGLVNLAAVAVLAHLAISGFASLWCAWAAVTSAVIAVHVRRSHPSPSLAATGAT
jgi:hypothetical protein